MKKWLPLVAMAALIVGALMIGSLRSTGPKTELDRTKSIASRVKCPTCQGLSVAQSKTPVSVGIFDEIARQVAAGKSDAEITSYLATSYGDGVLINPPATGAGSVVWVAPVVVAVGSFGALALALRRWRRPGGTFNAGDGDLVERARAEGAR
jgi:cytochrome c-type biogenesis protein CcmH